MTILNHAYILHRRLFRDSSLIIEFFTAEQGLIAAVAKGARNPKSKLHSALQFFSPLLISYYGKSELLGLRTAEINGGINLLSGKYLLSMLYVNELLCKLLHKFEAHPNVFSAYQQLIAHFIEQKNIEEQLRIFEMHLLQELGYGLSLSYGQITFNQLNDNEHYIFSLEDGIKQITLNKLNNSNSIYSGQILRKILQQEFNDIVVLSTAKQLFRQIFTALLQHKTINSRQLFAYTSVRE